MMKVSIIVPVLNEAERLPGLFANIEHIRSVAKPLVALSIELILVDGGSVDATAELLSQADKSLCCETGRAKQMNFGAQGAEGELLVFLHADTLLPANIAAQWYSMLQKKIAWAYSPVRLNHHSIWFRIIEWCMNTRSRVTHIATGDQVLCISRKAFTGCGGFADIELMEDVELSSRLRKRANPFIFSSPVNCSARKWLKYGIAKTVVLMWAIRAAYFFGVSPAVLNDYYYGKER